MAGVGRSTPEWCTSTKGEYADQGFESRKKKVIGEPYEGKPHVRFEVAGNGNQDMVKALRHSQRKQRATCLHHLSPRRHSLTLRADPGIVRVCARLDVLSKLKAGRSAQSRYMAKIIDTRCNVFENSSITRRNPGDISPENDRKLLWF